MKLKNILLSGLSLVLVAALAIGGTVAYLQDEDSDVNVMTLGNVSIEQIEQEYNEAGELVDFTQAKPLMPYVGTLGWKSTNNYAYRSFTMNNVVDKYVSVKNTGKSDAYVRTLIAFEMGEMTTAEWAEAIGVSINSATSTRTEFAGTWSWSAFDAAAMVIEVDGHNYVLYVATHQNAVKPGETTIPSLLQVYLSKNATNEDVEKIDGNGNGTYDILVVSQAVQAAGFADAESALNAGFGDITTTNHPWTNGVKVPVIVTNDAELKAAIDEGAEEIVLESGNYGVIDVTVNRNLTLSAAAKADVKIAGIDGQSNNNSTNVTIKGVTIDNSLQTEGWYTGTAQKIKPCVGVWGGNYTFENCTFYVTGESGAETGVMSWWTTNKGVMNFTNCTFNGGNGSARGMQIYGNYDLNVTNCTFNTAKDYSIKYVGAEGCVATFKNNNVTATTNFVQTGSAPYAGANYTLVFEGNTLATGINHVYVDNAEGQTITINGVVKAATNGAIY